MATTRNWGVLAASWDISPGSEPGAVEQQHLLITAEAPHIPNPLVPMGLLLIRNPSSGRSPQAALTAIAVVLLKEQLSLV